MKRFPLLALVLVWFALLGFAGYEAFILHTQAFELAALQQATARLTHDSAALRQQDTVLKHDLFAAERQLAALPPLAGSGPTTRPGRQEEMKSWIAWLKQLRRLFDELPAQRIPEMQFLTDEDWLRVAHAARLDSEHAKRRALAAIRDTAIEKFRPRLTAALLAFAKSSSPATVATIDSLASHFNPPLDPSILARYELSKSAQPPSRSAVEWIAQLKAPVDPDYDSRVTLRIADIGNQFTSIQDAPAAWIPNYAERARQAHQDYVAAHQGARPKSQADVLPFFNPPLDSETTEKLLRAARERLP